jgi:hypothetical protein
MYYVKYKFHPIQKHKFSVMYPGAHFVESVLIPPRHVKYCVNVSHPGRTGMLQDPHIASDAKTQVRCNVSQHTFCGIRIGHPRA